MVFMILYLRLGICRCRNTVAFQQSSTWPQSFRMLMPEPCNLLARCTSDRFHGRALKDIRSSAAPGPGEHRHVDDDTGPLKSELACDLRVLDGSGRAQQPRGLGIVPRYLQEGAQGAVPRRPGR